MNCGQLRLAHPVVIPSRRVSEGLLLRRQVLDDFLNLRNAQADAEWRLRLAIALSRFSPSDWDRLERELRFILDGAPSERPAVCAKAERKEAPQERVYRVPQDMTPEELHAELDRQLADEKERGDGSADSGFGNSGTAAG